MGRLRITLLTFLFILVVGVATGDAQSRQVLWYQEMEVARQAAEKDGLPILLFITYSGHNDEDIRLRGDVFSSPEFVEFARKRLVLLETDFASSGSSDLSRMQANRRMAKNLKVNTFPALFLLDHFKGKTTRIPHEGKSEKSLIASIESIYFDQPMK
ncbi:MAG: hypothetical protein AAFY98_04270 [Verrucomicrobiota bacterium]